MKLSFLLVAVFACQAYAAPSDSSILKTLQSKRSATVIVDVVGSDLKVLRNQVTTRSFATRANRIDALYDILKSHADSKQANILNMLNKEKMSSPIVVEQLWISNQIIVKNADYSVVEKLLAMDEVTSVREEKVFPLMEPIEVTVHSDRSAPQAFDPWGVEAINATQVHAEKCKGGNVVIGHIDTGARYTHEAFIGSFCETHMWLDPYAWTSEPTDEHGHGTHTLGTIVGKMHGIGVAPEAKCISCKGCDSSGCTEGALLACGQFMTCPTAPNGANKDCSKAPKLVSNSWGGGQGDSFYDKIIDAWIAAGIAPIFACGNTGPACRTANSPGDSEGAIAVGSTTKDGGLSDFSSLGPTLVGARIKPDVAGPGSGITSAYCLSDNSYATMSGTSMATPHVAGLAALLYSLKPDLTIDQLKQALTSGAQKITKTTGRCDGIPATTYPNNFVGAGLVNALNSFTTVNVMMLHVCLGFINDRTWESNLGISKKTRPLGFKVDVESRLAVLYSRSRF